MAKLTSEERDKLYAKAYRWAEKAESISIDGLAKHLSIGKRSARSFLERMEREKIVTPNGRLNGGTRKFIPPHERGDCGYSPTQAQYDEISKMTLFGTTKPLTGPRLVNPAFTAMGDF